MWAAVRLDAARDDPRTLWQPRRRAFLIALPIPLSREGRDGVNEPKFPWTV